MATKRPDWNIINRRIFDEGCTSEMANSSIRFNCYPRTDPPPLDMHKLARIFEKHDGRIGTVQLRKGLQSNEVVTVQRGL